MIEFPEFYVIGEDHEAHMAGCLPRQTMCGDLAFAPTWDGEHTDCPIVPQSQFETQRDLRPYEEWHDCQNDQNGYPACTLASLATRLDFYLTMSMGPRWNGKLDWHKAWKKLSGGYGGVALDSAMRYVEQEGFPIVGGGRVLVLEVWDIPTVAAFYSASWSGHPPWYGRYVRGGGGHAESVVRLIRDHRDLSTEVLGTWGREYGDNGYYRTQITQRDLDAFGAFAIRSAVVQ